MATVLLNGEATVLHFGNVNSTFFIAQHIPDTAHGPNHLEIVIGIHLVANLLNVNIHQVRRRIKRLMPNVFHKFGPRDRSTCIPYQYSSKLNSLELRSIFFPARSTRYPRLSIVKSPMTVVASIGS